MKMLSPTLMKDNLNLIVNKENKMKKYNNFDHPQNRLVRPYLYGAYGSNLDEEQMAGRCPNARKVGKMQLPDYELVFRNVADIRTAKGSAVEIGLWQITQGCEDVLDLYEGFPTLYDKIFITTPELEAEFGYKVMIYQMVDREWLAPPAHGYLQGIAQGYKHFDMDMEYLLHAVKRSFNEESPVRLDLF